MPNPFIQQQQFGGLKEIYKLISNSSNPIKVFESLAKQNPKLQPILQMLNNGSNPQQLFYSLCQQRGIDPQQFIKNITS